jgi:hypothetical protein
MILLAVSAVETLGLIRQLAVGAMQRVFLCCETVIIMCLHQMICDGVVMGFSLA